MVTVKLRSIETPDEALLFVLHDVVVSTFTFGGNRRFFGVDTTNFVGCRGGTRAISLPDLSRIPVAYVSSKTPREYLGRKRASVEGAC